MGGAAGPIAHFEWRLRHFRLLVALVALYLVSPPVAETGAPRDEIRSLPDGRKLLSGVARAYPGGGPHFAC